MHIAIRFYIGLAGYIPLSARKAWGGGCTHDPSIILGPDNAMKYYQVLSWDQTTMPSSQDLIDRDRDEGS